MPIDKKIKDTFNDDLSLENEDWLSPPDSLFEKIEEEIYPEKKKKPFFYWWMIPFVGIVLAILYFGFSYNFKVATNANSVSNKTIYNNQEKNSQQANKSFSDGQEVKDLQEAKTAGLQDDDNLNDTKNANDVENAGLGSLAVGKINAVEPEINQKQINKSQQRIFDKSEKPLNEFGAENTSLNAISTKIESKNDEKTISDKVVYLPTDRVEVAANSEIKNQQVTENSDGQTDRILQKNNINIFENPHSDFNISEKVGLERLNPPLILSISQEEEKLSIQPIEIDDLGHMMSEKRKWLFSAGVSYDFWNFKLNDNYQTALTPADFTHSNGNGFAIFTGLERRLRSGFSIKSQVSFGKIKFESGHNSPIVYDRDLENDDKTNEFDLTMASPLGFLNSNISVGRIENGTADTSSLVVDLNNSHVVTNVDFGLSILKDVYNYKSFSFSLEGGLGVNHLVSLKNDLYDFSVSKSGYYSGSAAITGNQEELNKTRPYYLLGAAFVCNIRRKNKLSLGYQFKQDFNAIYQSGNFSTSLNRHVVLMGWTF